MNHQKEAENRRFELGDRVIVTGQIVKTRADWYTRWLPFRHPIEAGVIVGARTLRNGHTEVIDEYGATCFHPEGDPIRAWQVATSLHRNPVHCLDHQVEHVAMRFGPGGIAQLEAAKWIDAHGGKIYLYDCAVQKADEPFPDGSFWQWGWGSIQTIKGTMKALAGDIIIRGVAGEFYPCKPEVFDQTYEVA